MPVKRLTGGAAGAEGGGGGEGAAGGKGSKGAAAARGVAPKGAVGYEGEDVVSGWTGDWGVECCCQWGGLLLHALLIEGCCQGCSWTRQYL